MPFDCCQVGQVNCDASNSLTSNVCFVEADDVPISSNELFDNVGAETSSSPGNHDRIFHPDLLLDIGEKAKGVKVWSKFGYLPLYFGPVSFACNDH